MFGVETVESPGVQYNKDKGGNMMVRKKLLEKYKKLMQHCIDNGDEEIAHGNADDTLCLLLYHFN